MIVKYKGEINMNYKVYYYSEIEVCNGDNIKVLKELTDFGNEYAIIMKYLSIEYGYGGEDIIHLDSKDMIKLLEIIENKTLFEYMDNDEWLEDYGRYFYNYENIMQIIINIKLNQL